MGAANRKAMLSAEARPRPWCAERTFAHLLKRLGEAQPLGAPAPAPAGEEDLVGPACLRRKPKDLAFGAWITDALVRCQGVLSALPGGVWPSQATEYKSVGGRVVALDPSRALGQSWWWLWRLKQAEYTHATAYGSDDCTRVYHTDGLEAAANAWLPTNSDYDAMVMSAGFDAITLAGFAVTVRAAPPPLARKEGGFDALPSLQQRMLLELEAGALETGPAVLAMMLVHDHGAYEVHETHRLRADEEVAEAAAAAAALGRVVASVTVTQTHSFRLRDLLGGYNRVLGDPLLRPTLPSLNASIFQMTMAIARKVRALATNRILKLNLTPDTVIFCPLLLEDPSSGELQSQGYGYEGMEGVRGAPFLWDFDPLYTKRLPSQNADYSANGAYLVMMLVLLASVRAQFGEAVSRVMLHRLTGVTVEGEPEPPEEAPADYAAFDLGTAALQQSGTALSTVLRSMLPSHAKDQEPGLSAAYEEVARDFQDLVRSEGKEAWAEAFRGGRPFANGLVRHLTGSARADTALFLPSTKEAHNDALLGRETAHRVEQRLAAVRSARAERLRT